MNAPSNDPIEALQAEKRRRAVILLGVVFGGIGVFVVALTMITREASSPEDPLARIDVTQTPRAVEFSVTEAGPVALWVEVEQVHHSGHKSTTATHAADIVVETEAGVLECDPTDVVMVADWTRSGSLESWGGRLASCELGRLDEGKHTLRVHFVPSADAPEQVEVRSIVLVPSREP